MTITLFEFREAIADFTHMKPHVVKGDLSLIERRIPVSEFEDLFGGYVMWRPPENPTPEMTGPAIGVWGLRNAARLRRLLGERGAQLVRIQGRGPEQELYLISKHRPG